MLNFSLNFLQWSLSATFSSFEEVLDQSFFISIDNILKFLELFKKIERTLNIGLNHLSQLLFCINNPGEIWVNLEVWLLRLLQERHKIMLKWTHLICGFNDPVHSRQHKLLTLLDGRTEDNLVLIIVSVYFLWSSSLFILRLVFFILFLIFFFLPLLDREMNSDAGSLVNLP